MVSSPHSNSTQATAIPGPDTDRIGGRRGAVEADSTEGHEQLTSSGASLASRSTVTVGAVTGNTSTGRRAAKNTPATEHGGRGEHGSDGAENHE
jgi:hypothetical protein